MIGVRGQVPVAAGVDVVRVPYDSARRFRSTLPRRASDVASSIA